MATTDAFVRLLARFEAPLLQRHCDEELRDQLRDVHTRLAELLEASEQLQAVREAVARLEAGQQDVWRSASAMEAVEATARLEGALHDRFLRLGGILRSGVDAEMSACDGVDTPTVSSGLDEKNPSTTLAIVEDVKAEPLSRDIHAGSETESDTEPGVLRPRASVPTQDHAKATDKQRPSPNSWEAMIEEAMAEGLQITTNKERPSEATMAHYVATLDRIIQQIELPLSTKFQLLANGRFNRLLKQAIRVFNRGKKVPQLAGETEALISILEKASERDAALQHGFSPYIEQLADLKLHMMGLAPRRRPYNKPKAG